MKSLVSYFLGMFAVISLSSCANGKKLQEEAPVAFEPAFYTIHLAQDDSNASRLNLYIPTKGLDQQEVSLDSVYFKGRKAELIRTEQEADLYVAYFDIQGKDKDFVMHADPRKEYGNTVPVLEKIPFDLEAGEAVVVFIKNGKPGYYKLKGIEERGTDREK